MKKLLCLLGSFSLFVVACSPATQNSGAQTDAASGETASPSLQIYSARHYDSDAALYQAFTDETGIKVDVREAKAPQLLETLKAEGETSTADVLIMADAGALWRFKDAGLTQPVTQADILQTAGAEVDSDNHWVGLARRVRVVAYAPDRIAADKVDTWDELASDALKGEICVRSSSNIYNLSLMAEMIARQGEEAAENWARQIVGNMARDPQGGDTDQIRAVAAGACSVAIVNHYYWVRLATSASEADREAASKTQLIVPKFADGGGAHVNITGAAIAKTADSVKNAEALLAFLMSQTGQELLTRETKELPLYANAAMPDGAELVPDFEIGPLERSRLGENQKTAQMIYDRAGWK